MIEEEWTDFRRWLEGELAVAREDRARHGERLNQLDRQLKVLRPVIRRELERELARRYWAVVRRQWLRASAPARRLVVLFLSGICGALAWALDTAELVRRAMDWLARLWPH